MTTFLLIPGAWHGPWCWERVVPRLEAAGHAAIAPALPGMGHDSAALAGVTLEGWARFVAARVAEQGEPVTLVGHSRGGILISQAAEYVPERIGTLVYLAAFLVPDGETMRTTLARTPRERPAEPDYDMTADGHAYRLRPEAVARTFYTGTEPAWQARAASEALLEPVTLVNAPLSLTPQRFGRVRRTYIECTEDRAIPLAAQRAMQAALPCAAVESLAADHSPFFSTPDALTESLLRLTVG